MHFNNSGFLLFNFNLNYSQFSNKFILENYYYTTDESIIKGIYVPFNHILLVECDLLHINDLECYFITSPTQCSNLYVSNVPNWNITIEHTYNSHNSDLKNNSLFIYHKVDEIQKNNICFLWIFNSFQSNLESNLLNEISITGNLQSNSYVNFYSENHFGHDQNNKIYYNSSNLFPILINVEIPGSDKNSKLNIFFKSNFYQILSSFSPFFFKISINFK